MPRAKQHSVNYNHSNVSEPRPCKRSHRKKTPTEVQADANAAFGRTSEAEKFDRDYGSAQKWKVDMQRAEREIEEKCRRLKALRLAKAAADT